MKQVKKNFLKERLIGILVILILTSPMVPCFTSCSHGNNPEKSKPEVEDKNNKSDTPNPPKPTDPVPGKTSDQLIEELAAKKLGKINQETYFHTFDVSGINSDKSQKELKDNMNPFNLGRKKGDESKKLYLISSKFEPNASGTTPTIGGLYESVADLKNKINEIFLNGSESSTPAPYLPDEDSYGFNTLADALEWKWNIVKSESEGKHFFYEQCYPWLTFRTNPTLYQYTGSNLKNVYEIADSGTDYIVRGLDDRKPEIYFYNISCPNYFRWWVTFINSNDKNQIYSFQVGPYYINVVYNNKSIIPPPADDAEYTGKHQNDMKYNYSLPVVHMLKLSTMVNISLGKEPGELLKDLEADVINSDIPKKLQYEAYKAVPSQTLSDEEAKKLAKEKVEGFIKINPFKDNFTDLSHWDVYLTFGEFNLGFGLTATQTPFMWHNTVKLTGPDADAYWGKCWE